MLGGGAEGAGDEGEEEGEAMASKDITDGGNGEEEGCLEGKHAASEGLRLGQNFELVEGMAEEEGGGIGEGDITSTKAKLEGGVTIKV